MPRSLLLSTILLFSFLCVPSMAIGDPVSVDGSAKNDSVVGFGKRFSFHTNVIDWCIATPNLGIEWDFSGKRTSRFTNGVHAKFDLEQGKSPLRVQHLAGEGRGPQVLEDVCA